jgi:hypothetical protein
MMEFKKYDPRKCPAQPVTGNEALYEAVQKLIDILHWGVDIDED